jgi:hypothetical protein
MPRLKIRLHGGLECEAVDPANGSLDVPPGATLRSVQDALGVPRGAVGLFVVDGELRHDDYAPPDGATVDIYPLFGGG